MPDEASRIARLEVRVDALERNQEETRRREGQLQEQFVQIRKELSAMHELLSLLVERTQGQRKDFDKLVEALADERTERRREAFTSGWQRVMLITAMVLGILGPIMSVLIATGAIGKGAP